MTVPIQSGEIAMSNAIGLASNRANEPLRKSRTGDTLLYRCILSLPIMGLFAEWLYPLHAVSNGSLSAPLIEVLYGLTLLLLLVGMFRLNLWISIPVHTVFIIGTWTYLFGRSDVLDWFMTYGTIIQHDVSVVMQEWSLSTVSPETRTLILMIGWSLLVSTVQFLAIYRGSIGLFAGATVVYLLCLETLLGLEVYPDIVRTALLLVILYGGISLSRLVERTTSSDGINNRHYSMWFVIVCVIASVTVGLAWTGGRGISIKPAQQISVQAIVDQLEGWSGVDFHQQDSRVAITGYGNGNEELGGPLQVSSKIVFKAESPVLSYWRGETFGYYDGRRWAEPQAYFQAVDIKGNLRNDSTVEKEDEQNSIVQKVIFTESMEDEFPLFGGGDISSVVDMTTLNDKKLVYLLQDEIADTIKYPATASSSPVKSYQVKVTIPSINADLLRGTTGTDPEFISKRYLQLPEQLPLRVKELGNQIIADKNNRYDAVQAVQTYLQNNYKYSLSTSVPPANRDFVDNFLFETRLGYCNHFSTSMVVLLRTQGIPARLVKGYAPGTLESGSSTTYVVKSSNAHSWVEVYFTGEGWIPFDPTPGFTQLEENSEPIAIAKQVGDEKRSLMSFVNDRVERVLEIVSKLRIVAVQSWYFIPIVILVTILILATIISIWRSRRHYRLWRLRYITRSQFPQREQMLQAAFIIWDEVGRRFGPMPKGVTLREYVHSLTIKNENLREELVQFVEQWENIAYDKTLINRVQSITFLQRCVTLAHSLY